MEYTSDTQPMQGITYDAGILYWYTGDSNTANPKLLNKVSISKQKNCYLNDVSILRCE